MHFIRKTIYLRFYFCQYCRNWCDSNSDIANGINDWNIEYGPVNEKRDSFEYHISSTLNLIQKQLHVHK